MIPSRICVATAVLVALVVFLADGPAAMRSPASPAAATLRLQLQLPKRAHQTFGLFTVRVRGRAARLPIRPLAKIPSSMRAGVAISGGVVQGRVTTFTVAVAIDDLRAAARSLTATDAARTLDLEVGDKTFPAFSGRGVTGTCPQSGFPLAVKAAPTGLRVGSGGSTWRRIALQAIENSYRWCTTDPLLRSQTFTGFSAAGVTVARLNDDALADLVVIEPPHTLLGFLGKGNGTFKAPFTILARPDLSPTSVTAVPDANGRSDLYVTDANGPVLFVHNQGGGTFSSSSLGFSAIDGAAANFDGSGGLNDAVFVDGHESSFFVVLDESAVPFAVPADTIPLHVTAGDFNDDGKYDIAGAGPAGVSIATGDGSGFFTPRGLAVQQPNLSTTLEAAPVGLNPDLVVGTTSGVLVVDFSSDLSYSGTPLQAGTAPVGVALADVTGDGRVDVIALDQNAAAINTWIATKSAYRSPVSIALAGRPAAAAVGRFNGDTRADVAVATNKGLMILLGRRSG